MLNEYFDFIELLNEKPSNAVVRSWRIQNVSWSGQIQSLYNSKVFIYGVALDGTNDRVLGYCNPTGFWYLLDDEICLFKWHQVFGELADYGFIAYMAHNSEFKFQQQLTKTRVELEKYIALVEMTNMYSNPLLESVERMKEVKND
jgi:hypothetical protein